MSAPHVPLRILVVEDHRVNVDLLLAVLRRSDNDALRRAEISVAPTLGEARAMAASADHDLIVLDMRLPDGNGLDLLADPALEQGQRPPVLAVTANAMEADRAAAMEAGCDDFLGKPYLPGDLIAAVHRVLNGARP